MNNSALYSVLREKLCKKQSRKRFEHSVAVGDWAARLGKSHGWKPERARLAGLLHDYAKEWSPKKLKKYVRKRRVAVPDFNFIWQTSPNMLHAYVSADVVRRKKWITNKKDVHAIASHTLGAPQMTLEDKILFVADFSAPGRKFPSAARLRRKALLNLDGAFHEAVALKMGWQLLKSKPIHPLPVYMWNRVVCRMKA